MRLLFVADPLEDFKTYKDSTYTMMREAARSMSGGGSAIDVGIMGSVDTFFEGQERTESSANPRLLRRHRCIVSPVLCACPCAEERK